MKRRNAECGKLRRPLKRNKITEGIYGSTLLYLKFLLLWVLVILADFILEFRFEFLWPFWLLLRSVYDSFKYQGLAFSVFFICIALTSDMICFFFIPVHWLFFAASTYVWVQYVWHTDKGVCLPTVMLWLLFLYIEAAVRLKDLRHMPFHLDLCRPFAAHCIGYPVVTLGFGFKSYVGYRIRQRKQKDMAKENDFYYQLLQQALPVEQQSLGMHQMQSQAPLQSTPIGAASPLEQHVKSNRSSAQYNPSPEKSRGSANVSVDATLQNGIVHNGGTHLVSQNTKSNHRKSLDKGEKPDEPSNKTANSGGANSHSEKNDKKYVHTNGTTISSADLQFIERIGSVNDLDEAEKEKSAKNGTSVKAQLNGLTSSKWNNVKESKDSSNTTHNSRNERKNRQVKATVDVAEQQKQQEDYCQRLVTCRKLETDLKRAKADLQSTRQNEQDLRSQMNSLLSSERQFKSDMQQLQHENEQLQSKYNGLMTSRQLDKQTISSLEKRIAEERKQRTACEASLISERRARRAAEEARSALQQNQPSMGRQECTEACKNRRSQLEQELKALRREFKSKEDKFNSLESEASRCKEIHEKYEMVLGVVTTVQEQNTHLEKNLSAETRIKLDLFSALGEVKRQLVIRDNLIRTQEKEIEALKAKIAQDLAVMPQDSFGPATSTLRLGGMTCPKLRVGSGGNTVVVGSNNENSCPSCISNLDPNATAYTPKGSLIASTEA